MIDHMKNTKAPKSDELRQKIEFYLLSLWLLFALFFLLTVDIPISLTPNAKFIGVCSLLRRNWLAIIFILMTFVSVTIMFKLNRKFKGCHQPPVKITKIKSENYEHLAFLVTYIVPLISIDLSQTRYVIVLGILLFVIGAIFVKMDLYLGNPTLALLGYHLYRIETEGISSSDGILVISRDQLSVGLFIKWIKITDVVWVAKEHK